jgi:hypothetical protein
MTLTNVQHISDLKKNLISLGTLDSLRYKYSSESRVISETARSKWYDIVHFEPQLARF